jgi:type IV secretion system protein VirB6
MACPAVHTGEAFLAGALAHVDCQALTIGAYGYGALADPGSPVILALGSLLTVFIALFGVRLLLGYPLAKRDVVTDVLRIGIVLTLATSWPAWRVLGYELVITGPQDIARTVGLASALPGSGGDLVNRLQTVDAAIAALNAWGSGRLGVATGDWFQLGFARSAFLTGTLAPLALMRLMAGILLALAPLMAGLMLFGWTRSLFAGWVKGLAATFLGSLALTLVLGAELALLEPWLQDALQKRAIDQQTLEAPVEILVATLVFALVSFGVLALMARVAFHPASWLSVMVEPIARETRQEEQELARPRALTGPGAPPSQAQSVSFAINESLQREQRLLEAGRGAAGSADVPRGGAPPTARGEASAAADALGSSYRRNSRRVSSAGRNRDRTQ